ncbi:MAG: hypothetical protein RLZZ163_122 [Actinomycetota bacterium]|jgi:predicted GH43/DUF377 family glycosyl hydrolase
MIDVERQAVELHGAAARVLGRMFIPGEEDLIRGPSRIPEVVHRVLDLKESDVVASLEAVEREFSSRHRDLREQFTAHHRAVGHLVPEEISQDRQLLIGAYLTQEYAIEGAAYFNPSLVPHPDEPDAEAGMLRFVLSVRAVGEGHISTIVFRSGHIANDGVVSVDPPSPFASIRADRRTVLRRRFVRQSAIEAGMDCTDLELVLGMLPDKFTAEDLLATMSQVDPGGVRNTASDEFIAVMQEIARSSYEVDFAEDLSLSERVLWPTSPDERRGMEDARFVRLQDEDEPVRYRASYTAFDGTQVSSRILETDDFRSFSSMMLTGPGAQNKGLAFFPRRVGGRYLALSRWDRESISLTVSEDSYHWNDVHKLEAPKRPWELVHIGNCGSPLELPEGWLVLTHGAGAMRQYAIGAMLLDRDDPTKVIGRLSEPLLKPTEDERNGYVPNVVYSCGAVVHGGSLVIPYGMSDWRIRFATVQLTELISALS